MKIHRRHLIVPALAIGLIGSFPAFSLSAEEEVVAKRVEAFRNAQIAQDPRALDELTAPELSYSHSGGRVEDKATFIKNATSGRSRFLSLQYKDPSIRVVSDAAIVRFHWIVEREAAADGKKIFNNLHILMTWQKQAGTWKLLTRASTQL